MNFLHGTYGIDILTLVLLVLASFLNLFDFTSIFGMLLTIYAIYRAFSKKIYKRRNELNIFISYSNKFLSRFNKSLPSNLPIYDLNNLTVIFESLKYKFNQSRQYKIVKCPDCKQKLRLPRGKGNLVVTCKKCGRKFDLRT